MSGRLIWLILALAYGAHAGSKHSSIGSTSDGLLLQATSDMVFARIDQYNVQITSDCNSTLELRPLSTQFVLMNACVAIGSGNPKGAAFILGPLIATNTWAMQTFYDDALCQVPSTSYAIYFVNATCNSIPAQATDSIVTWPIVWPVWAQQNLTSGTNCQGLVETNYYPIGLCYTPGTPLFNPTEYVLDISAGMIYLNTYGADEACASRPYQNAVYSVGKCTTSDGRWDIIVGMPVSSPSTAGPSSTSEPPHPQPSPTSLSIASTASYSVSSSTSDYSSATMRASPSVAFLTLAGAFFIAF